jgi:hypothetical protein
MIPALLLAASLCTAPQQIPAGPVHVEPQCSYFSGAIAAEGEHVFAAWMTSRVGCCSTTSITGSTSGGVLDARGSLRAPAQQLYNRFPSPPSVATNGTRSLVAWNTIFGSGTYVQFADEQGVPIGNVTGNVIRVADGTGVPRALWTGSEWIVVTLEGTSVVALHLRDDGSVSARDEAPAASLLDAIGSLVLVRGSGGVEAVTFSSERHLIPAIPANAVASVARAGDTFLVAWNGSDAGAQRLDAHGAPFGDVIVLDTATFDPKRVAVAAIGGDFMVLWNNSASIRAAIVHDGAVIRRFDAAIGFLLGAATTPDGVVALVSRGCGVASSIFLPRGAIAFEDSGAVSVAMTPQTYRAAVATARGTEIIWSEAVPATSSMRLFATFAGDVQARVPVPLSSGTYIYDADVVPMRDGTVAAWAEATAGETTVRAARFDANGELIGSIIRVTSATTILDVAVAADDDSFTVVAPEKQGSLTYFADLWATSVSAEGTIDDRTLIATRVEAYALDAAMGSKGAVASWFDYGGLPEVRTTVREPQALHVFTLPTNNFALQDLAANGTSLLVWLENGETRRLHALRADSGEDTIVAEVPRGKYVFANVDRAFRIVWAESDASETLVHPGPCLAIGNAFGMTLRNGALDALLTGQNGRVILARAPLPRRRAVR